MTTFPCPRCGRDLEPAGTVTTDDGQPARVVYQCDACLVNANFGDGTIEAALTFCIDDKGTPFDPASPDGSLPPPVTPP